MPSSRFENGALLQWRLRLGVRLGITLSILDQGWTRPTDILGIAMFPSSLRDMGEVAIRFETCQACYKRLLCGAATAECLHRQPFSKQKRNALNRTCIM